jgi:hypothetical protein
MFHHLRQITDGNITGQCHATTAGRLFSREYAQHCSLSGAILADKSYAVPFVDDETNIVKKIRSTKVNT